VTGETLTYGYDRLNRLSGVSGTWSQTYTYDGFGNLTGKSAVGAYPAMNASFDPLTNRQNGLGYDANGNVTANGAGYDVENRLAGDSTALYVYDHAGKRVQKRYQATEEYYFYGIGGQKLVTQVCQTTESGWGCGDRQYNVYFGGKLVKSKGVVVVTDRLGSVRANSNGERMSYYPYGEEKTTTADGREKFGTYTRDSATQDYADQRYYAVGMGRFNTPDPYMASGGPSDPGSWNRYIYTRGDPINRIDRTGRADECAGCARFSTTVTASADSFGDSGGGGIGMGDGPQGARSVMGLLALDRQEEDDESVSFGPSLYNLDLLRSLQSDLDTRLANSECAGIFGKAPGILGLGRSSTPTAASVLDSLISAASGGVSSPYGTIQFIDPVDGSVAGGLLGGHSAITVANHPIIHSLLGLSSSSTVYISTLDVGENFNTSFVNAETTILHELGHVLSNLNWKGDKILPDVNSPDGSAANDSLIKSKCGLGR
jgi:RHS repeat-associated protein